MSVKSEVENPQGRSIKRLPFQLTSLWGAMVAFFVTDTATYELRFLSSKPLGYESLLLALKVAIPVAPAKPRADFFMLSTQALQEFKEIWKHEFGEDISDDFAVAQAINLLTLIDVIYKPVKTNEYETMDA